jgi:hypothetical protein
MMAFMIVVLFLLLIASIPAWRHSRKWGYVPSGGLGFLVLMLVILIQLGRI